MCAKYLQMSAHTYKIFHSFRNTYVSARTYKIFHSFRNTYVSARTYKIFHSFRNTSVVVVMNYFEKLRLFIPIILLILLNQVNFTYTCYW